MLHSHDTFATAAGSVYKPPVEQRTFETALGPVVLSAEPQAFEPDRPVVLAISGAFAQADAFDLIHERLPEAAVFVAHLPGNHSPPLIATSVGAYAAAFSRVLGQLGRPAIVCGASVGGLVAMGLRAAELRGIVALDPPFRTEKLWRLIPRVQDVLRGRPEAHVVEFAWNVLGVSATTVEDRNYLPLLDGLRTPTWCVLGEVPLMPPRELARDPSLVDEPERQVLQRHAFIRTLVVEGAGHNLQGEAGSAVLSAIRSLLVPVLAGEPPG
jgi:pimeloyl-ACP methyl ester carboxylesterase